MSLNFQSKNELYFGEVISYDQEVAKLKAGNLGDGPAYIKLLPKNLKGTTHLWRFDQVAFWRGRDGEFEARLLKRNEYENLLKKLNLSSASCQCCYCTSHRTG